MKRPQKVFDHSFFWDEGVLCQEPPQSCYDRCCRAKKLTKGSFFLRRRPGASAALVLDVLTYEDEILWCRLSVVLSFVAVIHNDDVTRWERRRGGEEEQMEMEDGTRRAAHAKGVWARARANKVKVCGDFLCATMPSKVQGRGMRQIDV